MLMQGTSNAQYRFEVRMKADNRRIYQGYSSMENAERYARKYTGRKLIFTDEDTTPERDFGRDMGKPTVICRILDDGSRVPWREISLKGDKIVSNDTPAYKQEQEDQAVRNAEAVTRAEAAAAGKFAAEKNDMLEGMEALGDAMAKTLAGFQVPGQDVTELNQQIAELKQQIADAKAEPASKSSK